MDGIITRLRRMVEAGTADYTLGDEIYWDDEHLQDELDREKTLAIEVMLAPVPQFVEGVTVYHIYKMPSRIVPFEQPAGGTTVFKVTDGGGTAISTAEFTVDEWAGQLRFTANQDGSARYWTGYYYDLNRVAEAVWNQKAAHAWTAIDFSADGQRFTRSALYAHAVQMRNEYSYADGLKIVSVVRADQDTVQDTFE